jgi:hypothetical protein
LGFGFAEGLFLAVEFQVLVDVAGDALFVEGEIVESFVVEDKDLGLDDGMVDAGVFGLDLGSERPDFSVGEHVFFDGVEAVEAEVVEGYGLGEMEFDRADGVEVPDVGSDEGVLGFLVFFGHDDGEAGETMLEAVQAAEGFAFG